MLVSLVFRISLTSAMEVAAVNPASSNFPRDYQSRIELGFDQLKNDVLNFMSHEQESQEKIRKLENELDVYKLAIDRLQSKYNEAVKESEALKHSVKVCDSSIIPQVGFIFVTASRVVVLSR